MSVLFFAGAIHDVKNAAHYLKFSVAHKALAKAMKQGLTHGQAIDEVRKAMSKLFGFEISEGLIKQFAKVTKSGNSKNRFRILRELAVQKMNPALKEEVFSLLVHNPEIIDALKSGFIRGEFRMKRSLLRNLFENEKALTQFLEILSDPTVKASFVAMLKGIEKGTKEADMMRRVQAFFKNHEGKEDLEKLIEYNVKLLRTFGRVRVVATAPFKALWQFQRDAREYVRGVAEFKEIKQEIKVIQESLDQYPDQIQEALGQEFNRILNLRKVDYQEALDALAKIKEKLKALDDLEKIKQRLNHPDLEIIYSPHLSQSDINGLYEKLQEIERITNEEDKTNQLKELIRTTKLKEKLNQLSEDEITKIREYSGTNDRAEYIQELHYRYDLEHDEILRRLNDSDSEQSFITRLEEERMVPRLNQTGSSIDLPTSSFYQDVTPGQTKNWNGKIFGNFDQSQIDHYLTTLDTLSEEQRKEVLINHMTNYILGTMVRQKNKWGQSIEGVSRNDVMPVVRKAFDRPGGRQSLSDFFDHLKAYKSTSQNQPNAFDRQWLNFQLRVRNEGDDNILARYKAKRNNILVKPGGRRVVNISENGGASGVRNGYLESEMHKGKLIKPDDPRYLEAIERAGTDKTNEAIKAEVHQRWDSVGTPQRNFEDNSLVGLGEYTQDEYLEMSSGMELLRQTEGEMYEMVYADIARLRELSEVTEAEKLRLFSKYYQEFRRLDLTVYELKEKLRKLKRPTEGLTDPQLRLQKTLNKEIDKSLENFTWAKR